MALTINKSGRYFGLDLSGIFVTFKIDYYYSGTVVDVFTRVYVNKDSFEENIENYFKVTGIDNHYQFEYDYVTNGDIIQYTHNKILDILTKDVTEEVPDIDEFGKVKVDDKGKELTKEVVVKEKFVEENKVVVVHLAKKEEEQPGE